MLRQLLQVVERGDAVAPRAIARRLGIGEPIVRLMLDDLVTRGCLTSVAGACGTACAGCPISPVCAGAGTRLWLVTDAGRRLLSAGTVPVAR